MLYRVFAYDWADPPATPEPLTVPRGRQGTGRHDNPDFYTALYVSRAPESAVAEFLQAFRGRTIGGAAFVRPDGRALTLATLEDEGLPPLVDLDDPPTLVRIGRRPSEIATNVRAATQRMALDRFQDDAAGLSWWSTLEASWTNVTLFDVRLAALPDVVAIDPLHIAHDAVIAASERLSVSLEA